MREEPIVFYLKKLEEYRTAKGFFRARMANELGVPKGTYVNWCRDYGQAAKPSLRYTEWVRRFLEERHIISAGRWINEDGPRLLKRIGFSAGQNVMDFGSGRGDYSIILAGIVGTKGRVYAVDKDQRVLGGLMGRGRGKGLGNIRKVFVSQKVGTPPTRVPLRAGTVDAIWFSDVLHDGYFKKDDEKEKLLQSCYRVLKAKGFIAVHPVHMEERRLKRVIRRTQFQLEREYRGTILFHGEEFHKASVFKYSKNR